MLNFLVVYIMRLEEAVSKFLTFLSILVRVYINNFMLIYDELEGYPGITENQLNFFQQ